MSKDHALETVSEAREVEAARDARLTPIYRLDGQSVHVASLAEAVQAVRALLAKRASFFICTLNLDHLVKLRKDPQFRETYSRAALVTADGFPITVLARIDGAILHRTTGADLVEPLCETAAANDIPIYLVGPTDETLVTCIEKLSAQFPKLKVYGYTAPPHGFDPFGADAEAIVDEIRAKGARLCFVGLGAPKQEFFCAWASERIGATGFIPVGAALEFIAGTKRRAPLWMRDYGFEWIWRLSKEPRRLTRRYIESGALLMRLIFKR